MKKIIKSILIVTAIILAVLLIGFNGDLDFDEYIEVNSTPTSKYINY